MATSNAKQPKINSVVYNNTLNPPVLPLEHFKLRWAQMRKLALQQVDKISAK